MLRIAIDDLLVTRQGIQELTKIPGISETPGIYQRGWVAARLVLSVLPQDENLREAVSRSGH